MKIKEGYLLRKVAEENIVIYMGEEEGAFEGMIQLNPAGVYLWNKLVGGISFDDLLTDMLDKYEGIGRETAEKDLQEFIESIRFALDLIDSELLDGGADI